jgi:hypothetical protein
VSRQVETATGGLLPQPVRRETLRRLSYTGRLSLGRLLPEGVSHLWAGYPGPSRTIMLCSSPTPGWPVVRVRRSGRRAEAVLTGAVRHYLEACGLHQRGARASQLVLVEVVQGAFDLVIKIAKAEAVRSWR